MHRTARRKSNTKPDTPTIKPQGSSMDVFIPVAVLASSYLVLNQLSGMMKDPSPQVEPVKPDIKKPEILGRPRAPLPRFPVVPLPPAISQDAPLPVAPAQTVAVERTPRASQRRIPRPESPAVATETSPRVSQVRIPTPESAAVPVETPSVPVETPSVPVEPPSVPVETPSVPVEPPSVPVETLPPQPRIPTTESPATHKTVEWKTEARQSLLLDSGIETVLLFTEEFESSTDQCYLVHFQFDMTECDWTHTSPWTFQIILQVGEERIPLNFNHKIEVASFETPQTFLHGTVPVSFRAKQKLQISCINQTAAPLLFKQGWVRVINSF